MTKVKTKDRGFKSAFTLPGNTPATATAPKAPLPNHDTAAQGAVSTGSMLKPQVDPTAFLLHIDQIDEQDQPREHFDEAALRELADDMRVNGQLDPIVVEARGNNRYALLSGARRYRAARLAGMDVLRATLRGFTTDDDVLERLITQLSANEQRQDFTVFERAKAYQQLMDLRNLSEAELARRLSKSPTYVNRVLSVLKATKPIQDALADNRLSFHRWINDKAAVEAEFVESLNNDGAGGSNVVGEVRNRKATRNETMSVSIDLMRIVLNDLAAHLSRQGVTSFSVSVDADKKVLNRALKDYMRLRAADV